MLCYCKTTYFTVSLILTCFLLISSIEVERVKKYELCSRWQSKEGILWWICVTDGQVTITYIKMDHTEQSLFSSTHNILNESVPVLYCNDVPLLCYYYKALTPGLEVTVSCICYIVCDKNDFIMFLIHVLLGYILLLLCYLHNHLWRQNILCCSSKVMEQLTF